jgi:hypothetical protein
MRCDHGWTGGQGLLALSLEQALGPQLRLQPFELGEQGADARRLHGLDNHLVGGACGIGGDLAGDDHLQPGLRLALQAADAALPHHPVDGGAVVLQRQIDVAGGMAGDLGDLAAHPHEPVGVLDSPLQGEGQLRHRIGGGVAGDGCGR